MNSAPSLERSKTAGEFFKGSISHKHTETKLILISRSTNSDGETEKEAKVVRMHRGALQHLRAAEADERALDSPTRILCFHHIVCLLPSASHYSALPLPPSNLSLPSCHMTMRDTQAHAILSQASKEIRIIPPNFIRRLGNMRLCNHLIISEERK